MKLETAELLWTENYNLELREEYSGRGMYGNSTAGVVGTEQDFFEALAGVMEYGDEEDREMVADALRGMRTDSMGRDTIFY